MGKGFGTGLKISQQRAKQALPILVAYAKAGRDLTYKQLACQMGVHHHTLAYPLGAIGHELGNLGKKWGESIPPINCLVVNKSKHTPGKGIGFVMSYTRFHKLTPFAKKEVMKGLYADIWGYPKWNKVLRHFSIEPFVPANSLEPIATKAKYRNYGGGESDQHKLLKEYLSSHPQVLGIGKNSPADKEYPFISADRIDLLFRSGTTQIGVEVKAANVDEAELMRGLFQAVKYLALIEAHQRYEQKTIDARVLLAIGGGLSPELASLADLLDVSVAQNLSVPIAFVKKWKGVSRPS
jgi:hypothetical protein